MFTASSADSSVAYSMQYILAMVLNASMSPALIVLPASQFSGLSAFGFSNKFTIALVTDSNVHYADQ